MRGCSARMTVGRAGPRKTASASVKSPAARSLPIIPLCGIAAAEQALPDLPKNKLDPGDLRPALGPRAKLVVPALSDEISTLFKRGGATRWALRQAHWAVVPAVEDEAMRRIASALTQLNAAGGP